MDDLKRGRVLIGGGTLIRDVAIAADVDQRTLRNFLRAKPVRSRSRRRIEHAVARLGLTERVACIRGEQRSATA